MIPISNNGPQSLGQIGCFMLIKTTELQLRNGAEFDSHLRLPCAQSNASVRRFTKPVESLERSLEISRQRGRKRAPKRPNYKNVGEEEEEEKEPEEGSDNPEKAKGTEASLKGGKTSGEMEGECLVSGFLSHLFA